VKAARAARPARPHPAKQPAGHRTAALYDALAHLTPSLIINLNRAGAVSMPSAPAAGLEIVDAIAADPALKAYHLLPSIRGDFLFKLGRYTEAQSEFERAATLTQNARERALLLARAHSALTSRNSNLLDSPSPN